MSHFCRYHDVVSSGGRRECRSRRAFGSSCCLPAAWEGVQERWKGVAVGGLSSPPTSWEGPQEGGTATSAFLRGGVLAVAVQRGVTASIYVHLYTIKYIHFFVSSNAPCGLGRTVAPVKNEGHHSLVPMTAGFGRCAKMGGDGTRTEVQGREDELRDVSTGPHARGGGSTMVAVRSQGACPTRGVVSADEARRRL